MFALVLGKDKYIQIGIGMFDATHNYFRQTQKHLGVLTFDKGKLRRNTKDC